MKKYRMVVQTPRGIFESIAAEFNSTELDEMGDTMLEKLINVGITLKTNNKIIMIPPKVLEQSVITITEE